MKKILKNFIVAILASSIFFTSGIVVFADQGAINQISPYFTNCNICIFSFIVTDPGEALVDITYEAKGDVFREARATVKIQKRFLGIFWKTVDIGLPNNEWTATSNDIDGCFYNSFDVDGTGTYRAIFTVEIIGIDGSVDLIEDTIESKYS